MKEILAACLMLCVISTTAVNLAFTLLPAKMTAIVKEAADIPSSKKI